LFLWEILKQFSISKKDIEDIEEISKAVKPYYNEDQGEKFLAEPPL